MQLLAGQMNVNADDPVISFVKTMKINPSQVEDRKAMIRQSDHNRKQSPDSQSPGV
jgi:hypothetical protein